MARERPLSIFETREQATASNELARDFIEANLLPLLPNPPRIVEGTVDIGFVEMLDGRGNGDVEPAARQRAHL